MYVRRKYLRKPSCSLPGQFTVRLCRMAYLTERLLELATMRHQAGRPVADVQATMTRHYKLLAAYMKAIEAMFANVSRGDRRELKAIQALVN